MKDRTLSIIGIVLTLVSGWGNIIAFARSVLDGFKGIWGTLPPLIQLMLIIWLFWWIGNKK